VLRDRPDDDDEARRELSAAFQRIRAFERQQIDAGAVILKFWLHISKKEQAKRFKKLRDDPTLAWKVTKEDRKRHKRYDDETLHVEEMLRETSTAEAPWHLVPSTDRRYATVQIAETILAAGNAALQLHETPRTPAPVIEPNRRVSPLDQVDLDQALDRDAYDKKLDALQEELRRLEHLMYMQRVPAAVVYEGWDAAGKGGNIRRMTRELDPRGYEVVPVGPPQGAEKTHQYLWRFWRALPKAGHLHIFDRSWYGRVLVERVEGFATAEEWQRAYREINEFESELADYGMVLTKFWIHISKEEQLARFESRQATPHKQWKITEDDWRNREKWDAYWDAVSDMIERTSTPHAPWVIVEGNDKLHARVRTLEVVTERLGTVLR
jgi:polyphosphate:AMP phosphotransferase